MQNTEMHSISCLLWHLQNFIYGESFTSDDVVGQAFGTSIATSGNQVAVASIAIRGQSSVFIGTLSINETGALVFDKNSIAQEILISFASYDGLYDNLLRGSAGSDLSLAFAGDTLAIHNPGDEAQESLGRLALYRRSCGECSTYFEEVRVADPQTTTQCGALNDPEFPQVHSPYRLVW